MHQRKQYNHSGKQLPKRTHEHAQQPGPKGRRVESFPRQNERRERP